MRALDIDFALVDAIPTLLTEGTVYVSLRYRTTAHLCLCGCGEKVVHPLRPHRWQLVYDGESISLEPSIGNDGLPCRSHYWITRNRVHWLPPLTTTEINRGRQRDRHRELATASPATPSQPSRTRRVTNRVIGWVRRLVGGNRIR